jgi:sugar/nucleoside kinase (ribokinase family)
MSLLVVGSVAFDSITTPAGSAQEILGGSASYFSASASYFTDVKLVAVVGEDFTEEHVEIFKAKNVDIRGLERVAGQTFRWAGVYSQDMNQRTTLYTYLNVFADFSPKIPADYSQSRYLFLGNIAPQLQLDVLAQISRPRLVACDTMNFWISDHREALLETIKMVDILLINDQETQQLAEESNLLKAARRILTMGPKVIVVKRGEYGALMLSEKFKFWVPAFPLDTVCDPTGAGDSFAGGFIGYLANVDSTEEEHLRRAAVYGSVIASFAVEEFGLSRVIRLTQPEIQTRFQEFKKLTEF